MNIKKVIVTSSMVALMVGMGSFALAQETAETTATATQKMVLEVGAEGKVLMRGTVSAVGANSVTVKSWGGDWVVNVASSTTLAPATGISQFVVGDFVGIQGKVSATAAWTIDATLVRNWAVRKQITENKQEIKGIIKSVTARNWEGVVGDVNTDGSFKLKVGGATYDIKMATGAKIVDKNFATMDASNIKTGNTVRVYGPATETTITASVVRNVSYDLKAMTK